MTKSTMTETLVREDSPVADDVHDVPNADGIYESAACEIVVVGGGNICHLLVANTASGYLPGLKLFTRQPRNLVTSPPAVGSATPRFPDEDRALRWAADAAWTFFAEHKEARRRLREWALKREIYLGTEAELEEIYERGGSRSGAETSAAASVAQDGPAEGGAAHATPAPTAPVAAGAESNNPSGAAADTGGATIPPRPHYAEIALEDIERNPDNPRRVRDAAKQAELVESLRTSPLLQPIAVRDMGDGRAGKSDAKRYRIIFGEGRWLAYQVLGRPTIEAKVFAGVDAATALAFALVENLQRADMNAIDEAEGFSELSRLGWTPARMAEQTGKATRTIRRALGLMKLPETVRYLVREGELTARHARTLAHWVVPPGFEEEQGADGWVARPQVCEVIAAIAAKSQSDISARELEEQVVPRQAVGQLLAEKLLARIPAEYWGKVREGAAEIWIEGNLYTFDVEGWRALKRGIDAEERQAEAERRRKAERRVEAAKESKVSVPVSALKVIAADHVILTGELERFAEHLPEELVAPGIDPETKAEVFVCTQPKQLEELRKAVREAEQQDDAVKIGDLLERAWDALHKCKASEFLVALAFSEGLHDNGGSLDDRVAKRFGVKLPKGQPANWDSFDAVGWLMKVGAANYIKVHVGERLADAASDLNDYPGGDGRLLWWLSRILKQRKLGLVRDDARERDRLIARVAEKVFQGRGGGPAETKRKPAPKGKRKGARKS